MPRFDFNPDEYKDEANRFTPVPKGEYKIMCVEAEEFDTRSGDGSYIKAKFEIVDGPYARRKIFQNFNVNNPSEEAQKIGRGQIYAWRMACNKPNAVDTDQLLEVPFIGLVDIEPGKPGYSDQNRIRRFLDPNEAVNRSTSAGAYAEPRHAAGNGTGADGASAQPAPERREPRPRPSADNKKPWDDDIPF